MTNTKTDRFSDIRGQGLGALWIVTVPTPDSELGDILFQATPSQIGGLDILGWFESKSEATQIALQALYLASAELSTSEWRNRFK